MAKKAANKLEESMGRLEAILLKMEEDDSLTLEETFALYGEGMKLVGACNASIDGIEKQLITLMKSEEEESGSF